MRKRGSWLALLVVVTLVVALHLLAGRSATLRDFLLALHGVRSDAAAATAPLWTDAAAHSTTLPFELADDNIYLRGRVAATEPLWFLLDTGDRYAILDLDRARALGLRMAGEVDVRGGGENRVHGVFLLDARFALTGLRRFSQPLAVAVPLSAQFGKGAGRTSHPLDGILGADFLRRFVVEMDYAKRLLTLHDKAAFTYTGTGRILPLNFDADDHPEVRARLVVGGHALPEGDFVLDLGASRPVILNAPFVRRRPELSAATPATSGASAAAAASVDTAAALSDAVGIGGRVHGRDLQVDGLRIGDFLLRQPVVLLSTDTAGAFADANTEGTLGGGLLRRFRVILDYGRRRVILEPTAALDEPFAGAAAGTAPANPSAY